MAVRRLGAVVRRPLVIDTDGGVDDAIAVLVAVASPEVDLRAVTTVYGNVSLEQATENALRVLALAGAHHVLVVAGAQYPLARPRVPREGSPHGPDGLGGHQLPPAKQMAERVAAGECLAELLRDSPTPVTVCALGPLTNVAHLIRNHPPAAARIGRLVTMSGSYDLGTMASGVDFNVESDPEAAQHVLGSGLPITRVSLDLTQSVLMDAERVRRIAASGPVGLAVASMLAGRLDRPSHDRGGQSAQGGRSGQGVPLHDAVAVLEAIRPGTVVRAANDLDAPAVLAEIETRLCSYGRQ